jgi:transposase
MTKTQVEVITSVQRRRRWSRSEKERIVAAAIEPGAVLSEVARAAGIHTSQLFRWRQELCGPARATPRFSAVTVVPGEGSVVARAAQPMSAAAIEVEFASGTRMRFASSVDPSTSKVLLTALAKVERHR